MAKIWGSGKTDTRLWQTASGDIFANGHRGRAHTFKEGAQFVDTVLPPLRTATTPLNGAFNRESGGGTPDRKQPLTAT